MPPSLQELEVTGWAKSLPLDELRLAFAILEGELNQREGRLKFRLPEHIERMLN